MKKNTKILVFFIIIWNFIKVSRVFHHFWHLKIAWWFMNFLWSFSKNIYIYEFNHLIYIFFQLKYTGRLNGGNISRQYHFWVGSLWEERKWRWWGKKEHQRNKQKRRGKRQARGRQGGDSFGGLSLPAKNAMPWNQRGKMMCTCEETSSYNN